MFFGGGDRDTDRDSGGGVWESLRCGEGKGFLGRVAFLGRGGKGEGEGEGKRGRQRGEGRGKRDERDR